MNIVKSELCKLSEWFKANKLSLNIKKTHYIIFGNRSKACFESNFHIVIESNTLERVPFTKFLGVFVDEDLNWKCHASQIALKISKNIGVINRIKYLLTCDALLSLYYTMIHPYLLYCNIIWGGASQLALHRLTVLQKRAVRMIACSGYRSPSSPLFKQFGILKLCDIHKLQVYLFMFKCKYKMLPNSCLQLVNVNSMANRYEFRKEYEFVVVKFHTECRRKAIAIMGPDLWNSLQDSIRHLSSISVFKSKLVSTFIEGY